MLILVVAVPAVIGALSGYSAARGANPSDDDLTARFFSHQADFEMLPQMLDSDCGRRPLADGPFDLSDLMAAGAANNHDYRALLARIEATNIRYLPGSGDIALRLVKSSDHSFADTKKSYLYLNREQPQPPFNHSGYPRSGIYFVMENHRIKDKWFIHYDRTVAVAFAAY